VVLHRADHLQLLDRWNKIVGRSAVQPELGFQTEDPGERIFEPFGADLARFDGGANEAEVLVVIAEKQDHVAARSDGLHHLALPR
jgi:hypothetical protein